MDVLENLNFRALFDATVNAMLLTDDAGRIVFINPAAQQLFGYSENELCSLEIEALIPRRYRKQHRHFRKLFFSKPNQRALNDGKGLTALRRDGKEIKLDISLSPLKVREQLYVLVTFNVADRRLEAEEALRMSEERLRLAKQAAGLGIYDYDCKRNIIYWDEQMRGLWGRSEEMVTYKEFLATIHPEDRLIRKAAFDSATDNTGKGEFNAEYRIIDATNGAEHWIASAGKAHFENGHAYRLVGVIRDVTEEKKLQKRLQAQQAETENLVKQQVASCTASAIAHELNQPLTAISAYSEVALQALHNDTFNPDDLKKALEGCVTQAQRAGLSLHELLAFLQKGDVETEQLNLNDIVNETLEITRNNGYDGFISEIQLAQNLPAVQGNRIQVQKVLANLFRNAIEAMQSTNISNSAATILVQTSAEINMAMVTVQDYGPGVNQEATNHVFDPFFTTKAAGLGMGLAISRALIESNGGQLWVDPNATSGAKFHFTLPYAA